MKNCFAKKKKKRNVFIYCFLFFISLVLFIDAGIIKAQAEDIKKSGNKFNVVVVMDSSNSMNYTDPEGYRFEAVGLFVNLLTQEGNTIGSVVFSNDILSKQGIISADGQAVKDSFMEELKGVEATGYTNIGKGLNDAVDMLVDNGANDLNSVILFLSDGNTEMPNEEKLEESLEQKSEAIQKARENDIEVYSVCLNANNEADVSEMEQIADATGGVFEEVKNAEDLRDVFNRFYDIVYGSSTIKIGDLVFDDSGEVTQNFTIPAFGVEEVNIIIYGKIDDVSVLNPDGEIVDSSTIISNTYTIVKFQDVSEGEWTFVAHGSPGTQIKVNMVYNSDISLDITSNYDEKNPLTENEDLEIYARMVSNEMIADQDYQYAGFEAELIVMNAYREEIRREAMSVKNGSFFWGEKLSTDTYYFKVCLSGNQLSKESEEFGPISIITAKSPSPDDESEDKMEIIENTSPYPTEKLPIEKTVYIIPFKDNSKTISVVGLAKDKEDDKLKYIIESSSFIDGDDYIFDGEKIVISNYSLRKGAFTVRAYDSQGLYCEIEIIVKSINVGVVTLIVLAIIALIVLIIIVSVIYKLAGIPFRGDITVRSFSNGVETGIDTKRGVRGHIPLSRFRIQNVGFAKDAKFQATGKDYIEFKTKQVFYANGLQYKKKVEIQGNGTESRLSIGQNSADYILVVFTPRQYKSSGGNPQIRGFRKKGKGNGYGSAGVGGYGTQGGASQGGGFGYGSQSGNGQGGSYGYGTSNYTGGGYGKSNKNGGSNYGFGPSNRK